MKIEKSPLKLIDFFVLKNETVFFHLDEEDQQVDFESYDIDLDYAIPEDDEDFIQVFMKVEINFNNEPKPGYKIFVEGVGLFKLEEGLDENDVASLIGYSGVGIMVNNLRSFIRNLTSYFPHGSYLLPSVDLDHLVISKREQFKKEAK